MRTYLIGATTVKSLIVGLEVYKTLLTKINESFLSGYNVSAEVRKAVAQELTRIDEWLKKMKVGHEYAYTELPDEERLFLRHVLIQLQGLVKTVSDRFSDTLGSVEFKELSELSKKLEEALESTHFDVKSTQGRERG